MRKDYKANERVTVQWSPYRSNVGILAYGRVLRGLDPRRETHHYEVEIVEVGITGKEYIGQRLCFSVNEMRPVDA